MIQLTPEHQQTIIAHAESTYPEECCGIMLGYLVGSDKTVVTVIATENAWNEQENNRSSRYAVAPSAMLQAQKAARDQSIDIIGIYHSHPDHPARPSECDRVSAWQTYSYAIVSVEQGKAGEMKSWCLDDDHEFQPEEIQIKSVSLHTIIR